ncbi:peroxiredoxin family protein [Paenibacillus glucanolyticus]|uniref:peroxiredoxin family protein n=1 Tax=Paenibacillus glucanolyticus TaxID=59843 RepID=UPI00096C3DF1|nr:TlpA disulfide reductase family protein [Paenibacillus glucanolyticus]OMF80902.1 cytochrome C biogenesis protein [Paenibacillus glucanolyticus]
MKKNWITIIVLLGLITYGAYDYFSKSSANQAEVMKTEDTDMVIGIEKGQAAPDFVLQNLQGEEVRLSDFQGKTVMVNFWATWCPPCRIEMPHMQKFFEDYNSKDVVIIGVNMTPSEKTLDSVKSFVDEQQLTFPIVLDMDGSVTQTYQIIAYPSTVLIDSRGVIQEKFRGAINYEMMKEAVARVR